MGKPDYKQDVDLTLYKQDAENKYMPAYAQSVKDAQGQVATGAAQQLQNNRLNTSNPFASQTFNPDGSVSQQFTGGMGQAFNGLQSQAAGMSQPMDWNQFGQAGTGDSARDQAIQSAYGQSTSRLDPMWNQREDQARTRLMNQGLDPSSEAFKNEMGQMGRDRNDAYQGAMSGAIAQGTAAGDSAFRNNMSARTQAISEALKKRGMPLEELQKMQGFLSGQPQYNADNTSFAAGVTGGNLGTQGAQSQFNMNQQEFDNWFARLKGEQQNGAATAQGGMAGLGALAGLAGAMGF